MLLPLIVIVGIAFRFIGLNWDDYTHLHPDERFLTMVESSLSLPGAGDIPGPLPPGCAKWGGYFDTACSPLNPYNHDFGLFVYGTFPIFLTRIVGGLIDQTGYDQIHLVGRFLSALFDLSTVLLIYFVARRLYGQRVALLSALFLAASVLDIQQSHFFTVDTFTNVPIILAFWFALDIADGKKWPAFIWAGITFGFALAGRINIAPFAAVLILAAALRAYREIQSTTLHLAEEPEEQDPPTSSVGRRNILGRTIGPLSISVDWLDKESVQPAQVRSDPVTSAVTRAFAGLALAGLVTLVVFRIAQPYSANGPNFISPTLPRFDLSRGSINFLFDVALSWAGGVNPKFADNMQWASDTVAGKIDAPPGHQWTNRTPYVFPFENMVLWGLGLPLGLAAWAGFLVALYLLLRYRQWKHLLVVAWVGITFAYTGQQFVKTMRYFLQIYPFLALLAGFLLIWLWDKVTLRDQPAEGAVPDETRPRAPGWGGWILRGAVGLAALVVIGYTLFWAAAFTSIYTRPYTRVAASLWIFDNIPPGSVLANEHWDDPLPVRISGRDPFGGMYRTLSSSSDGEMHWYDEDTPEKRTQAIQWLDDAQYIILSSNRLYGSIPRLPMRYPMTTKYYQWLFDGTLGFDRIATFTSRPQLFGIEINDDNAEEAFTVYDHPKVIIFKKSPRYSHSATVALFNSVDLTEVYRFTPPEATQAKTALLLTPSDWTAQMEGGTWSQIFDPQDWINRIPVIGWLGMVELFGWLIFPVAFAVFRGLCDRGYIFAKGLGILIPAWGAWILASLHLLPFSRYSIALILLCILLASALALRLRAREMIDFVRRQFKVILVEESLFLAFFGAFLLIRYGNPDLWHPWYGGEKPMDFAFLNAITKATWFPPYDPWFAGGYINYYYFGQLITATLIRFSGIVTEVAYNLALPMYFALTAMGAFSVVFNLVARIQSPRILSSQSEVEDAAVDEAAATEPGLETQALARRVASGIGRPVVAGVLGALFVAVIGNLGELILIAQALMKMGDSNAEGAVETLAAIFNGLWLVIANHQPIDIPIGWWYWNASRVIPDTINEFPFFTFLYADLHAHLMSLAFTLVVLGFAVSFVMRERDDPARLPFWPYAQISPMDVIEVVFMSLVLGALRAINFADYPTYLLVVVCALAIGEYGRRRRIDLAGAAGVVWRLATILVLGTVLYQPFVSNFATAYLSTELWKGTRTTLGQYLVVHGIFLFIIATYLVWQTFDTKAARGPLRFGWLAIKHVRRFDHFLDLHHVFANVPTFYEDLVIVVSVAALLIEIVLFLSHSFLFAFAFPLLVLAGLLVVRPDLGPGQRLVALLVAAGLAMTIMVELITYKGDIGRMNTVFKFYLQVWVFFGICAAVGLAMMMEPRIQWRTMLSSDGGPIQVRPIVGGSFGLSGWWWSALVLLLFAGFLYPVFATRAKVNDRFVAGSPPGLNGMDYMNQAVYADQNQDLPLVYDREAIDWLRENISGSPVILEGNAPLYHWGDRISINTGLPTVIGWDWHEKQQRSIIDGAIIDQRIAEVKTMYDTTDVARALMLMNRFHVSYIYVGDMERAFYDANGLAKFDAMAQHGQLGLVYQNEHVKIYKVIS